MNLRQIIDQDKGLGDTLKRVSKVIGLKPCAPCQKRAEMLNKMLPYRKDANSALTK